MRVRKRILTIGALTLSLAMAAGTAVAVSGNPYVEASGDRVSLFALGDSILDVDTPFHISHGWLNDKLLTKYPKGSAYFLLAIDGQLIEHTAISDCPPEWANVPGNCELYVYDFPQGIQTIYPDYEPGIQVYFEGHWMAPCSFAEETTDKPEPFTCPYEKWDPTVVVQRGEVERSFGEEPPSSPSVALTFPAGNLEGAHFPGDDDGFEFLANQVDPDTGTWMAYAGMSDGEGNLPIEEVASLVPDQWVGIRHEGGDVATLQIVDITFDFYDGDTASGTSSLNLEGRAVFVCHDDGADVSECPTDADIVWDGVAERATWSATGLGGEPDWEGFVQYHDAEGDVQEMYFQR